MYLTFKVIEKINSTLKVVVSLVFKLKYNLLYNLTPIYLNKFKLFKLVRSCAAGMQVNDLTIS